MAKPPTAARPIKAPSYLDAAAPILLLIILVILAQVLFDGDSTSGPFQIALIVCALFAAAIGRKNGHDLRDQASTPWMASRRPWARSLFCWRSAH